MAVNEPRRKIRMRWLRTAASLNPDDWPWRVRTFARIEGRIRYWIWRVSR